MGEATKWRERNPNTWGVLRAVGLVVGLIVGMISAGFIPKVSDIYTRPQAEAQKRETQNNLTELSKQVETLSGQVDSLQRELQIMSAKIDAFMAGFQAGESLKRKGRR